MNERTEYCVSSLPEGPLRDLVQSLPQKGGQLLVFFQVQVRPIIITLKEGKWYKYYVLSHICKCFRNCKEKKET